MNRRINRFKELLESKNKKLIFIRKGHRFDNCGKGEGWEQFFSCKNDLDDCNELFFFLKNKYPKLKFKIIIILCCNKCFNCDKVYSSDNIEIHNTSSYIDKKESDDAAYNILDKIPYRNKYGSFLIKI